MRCFTRSASIVHPRAKDRQPTSAKVVASLVAASPDVIVAGPELPLRALSSDANYTSDRNDRGHGRRWSCGFLRSTGRQHYGD
jgi:hypothetical protein